MEYKDLLYEKANGVAVITLHRPQVLNALNDRILEELSVLMDQIAADNEVKSLVITGGSKVFAAGADIGFMSSISPLEAEKFVALAHQAINKIADLDKPVIAAIAGLALGGGCELALSCDIRIAAAGSRFGLPEINLGLYPGGGGTQRLARLVGPGWAKHLLMTGKPIDSETAFQIGLITKIVPVADLIEESKKLAAELAAKSAIAMRLMKKAINYTENVDLASGLLFEQKTWAFLMSTEDAHEGLTAFLEKRPPVFKGK
ncbi:enoyl-coa hydratase [hydrocarbon metagenome]|uniref:Enoyl-coa hydratase n=1 Tax=hydrocarbon metagenome TaxID=938273 RepID=A0A0W8E2C2_9ZZZZ